jgi:hypothetical protein
LLPENFQFAPAYRFAKEVAAAEVKPRTMAEEH